VISIQVHVRTNNLIGEGPLWSASEQALYWLDIGRKQLHRKALADPQPQSWTLPDYPGCLAEIASDRIAVAMGEGVHQVSLPSGAVELLRPAPARRPGTRFNDGKVDPKGRLWAGTMQNNFAPEGGEVLIDRCYGALYRFDADGHVDTLEEEIGIANTLAWSPDLSRFYFGDSLKGVIFVYDFDPEAGTVHNKRPFHQVSGLGVPDGSAMDVDGCLWNARWDGGAVLKITPEGKVDRVIHLPIPRPTSCIFGGPDLKTLFVTSAVNGLTAAQREQAPLSGAVFAVHGAGQGLAVPPMTLKQTEE